MLLYGQLPSGSSLWWAGSFWYLTKKKKKAAIKYVPGTWALLGWKQRGGGREQGLMLERKGCVCVCVCVPPLLHRAACLPPRGAMFITTSCFAV